MTGRANIADVRVIVDGKDITPKLLERIGETQRRRLVSLSITEKRGGEADQLDIVIDDTDGRMAIPRAKARIQIALGWAQGGDVAVGLVDKGSFVVDEVAHAGPPDLITIRARAADFTSEIRTRREGSWHDTTLGAIVADIARRNELEPRCAPALASIAIAAKAQSRESDIAFLRRLGRAYDAVATVKNGKLLLAPIGAATSPSGKPISLRTIRRRDGDRHSYSVKAAEEVGTVEAGWHDRGAARRTIEKVGGGSGKTRRLSRTYPNRDDAKAAAQAEHRRAQRAPVALDLSLALGDPTIGPDQRVTVVGYKEAIARMSWLIEEVNHTLEPGRGLATTIKLEGH